MTNIVGIRFRIPGKIGYYHAGDFELHRYTHVIVPTNRGTEFGTVICGPKDIADEDVKKPVRNIIRIATPEDEEHEAENRVREREAYAICKEKIADHHLNMKLVKSEYTFDNNKLLFYFTADGRVDFRDLVKDLAGVFHTRIELRQVGVRDETKLIGGYGICGRELCCHSFLSDFAPVSIKMAKEQNLSLNPSKISGVCGRLMCCLNNEAETYEYLNKNMPKNHSKVITPDGIAGVVHGINILRQSAKVLIEHGDEREIVEYSVNDLMTPEEAEKAGVTIVMDGIPKKNGKSQNGNDSTGNGDASRKNHVKHDGKNSGEFGEAHKSDDAGEKRESGRASSKRNRGSRKKAGEAKKNQGDGKKKSSSRRRRNRAKNTKQKREPRNEANANSEYAQPSKNSQKSGNGGQNTRQESGAKKKRRHAHSGSGRTEHTEQ